MRLFRPARPPPGLTRLTYSRQTVATRPQGLQPAWPRSRRPTRPPRPRSVSAGGLFLRQRGNAADSVASLVATAHTHCVPGGPSSGNSHSGFTGSGTPSSPARWRRYGRKRLGNSTDAPPSADRASSAIQQEFKVGRLSQSGPCRLPTRWPGLLAARRSRRSGPRPALRRLDLDLDAGKFRSGGRRKGKPRARPVAADVRPHLAGSSGGGGVVLDRMEAPATTACPRPGPERRAQATRQAAEFAVAPDPGISGSPCAAGVAKALARCPCDERPAGAALVASRSAWPRSKRSPGEPFDFGQALLLTLSEGVQEDLNRAHGDRHAVLQPSGHDLFLLRLCRPFHVARSKHALIRRGGRPRSRASSCSMTWQHWTTRLAGSNVGGRFASHQSPISARQAAVVGITATGDRVSQVGRCPGRGGCGRRLAPELRRGRLLKLRQARAESFVLFEDFLNALNRRQSFHDPPSPKARPRRPGALPSPGD